MIKLILDQVLVTSVNFSSNLHEDGLHNPEK